MGKRNKRKNVFNEPAPITPQSTESESKEIKQSKIRVFWNKFKDRIIFISVLIGIIAAYEPVTNIFKTSKEKYDEDHFDEGVLKPPPVVKYKHPENPPNFSTGAIKDNYPPVKGILLKDIDSSGLVIELGNEAFGVGALDLYEGVEFTGDTSFECNESHLVFGLKDDRLYVSAEFKDLQKEETIGFIEYNHWKIFRDNRLVFRNTDDKLEVKDRQNNVVFSIKFYDHHNKYNNPMVRVSGYFINPTSVLIIKAKDNTKDSLNLDICILKSIKNWKQKALVQINDIKSVF